MKLFNSNYIPKSGSKPRYDGGGSEFGLIHRELPKKCGMFDIDRISATAVIDLELKNEDVAFLEYRTNFETAKITWKALFEIKRNNSESVQKALNCRIGTATWAQMELCQKINARYFIVIATKGKQPFQFWEILDSGIKVNIGILDYNKKDTDGIDAVKKFWQNNLKLL